MAQKDEALQTCEALARANAIVSGSIDRSLGAVHGLGFTDVLLMRSIANPKTGPLRRIDLAETLGMTSSGVTRALIPLEKVGMVNRTVDPNDARASRATLTDTGATRLGEATTTAASKAQHVLSARLAPEEIQELGRLLAKLAPESSA